MKHFTLTECQLEHTSKEKKSYDLSINFCYATFISKTIC